MSWDLILVVAMSASLLVNVFLIWYIVKLVRELVSVSSTLEELFLDIRSFSNHLKAIYELETFYGDQTLENLLSHAKALTEEFIKYESVFDLTGEVQDDREASEEASPFAKE
tara:strand:- start:959 stop:1294 length:336 start_codon:yes stop_codon:yes gene_type:complete